MKKSNYHHPTLTPPKPKTQNAQPSTHNVQRTTNAQRTTHNQPTTFNA